jgi:hypothetical protein
LFNDLISSLFSSSYLLDYSVLIILLFRLLPVIDSVCDFIGQTLIDIVRIVGKIIIYVSKIIIRFGLYYFMAILYVFWFALIINVLISLVQVKNYESINIFGTFIEEQNNLINKIDIIIYANYNR